MLAILLFLPLITTMTERSTPPITPQVFADQEARVFHSPSCAQVTRSMLKMARSVAKMQRYQPATECAQSDADAAKEWGAILAKNPGLARGGTLSAGNAAPKDRANPKRSTAAVNGGDTRPSQRDSSAEKRVAADTTAKTHCGGEWPGNERMQAHCEERAMNAKRNIESRTALNTKVWPHEFDGIRRDCAAEWPGNYSMQDHCEARHIANYQRLRQ